MVVELATSPLSRLPLRDLLFSAMLVVDDDEAAVVVGSAGDVDEEETPRSRATSLISRHSIFADSLSVLLPFNSRVDLHSTLHAIIVVDLIIVINRC